MPAKSGRRVGMYTARSMHERSLDRARAGGAHWHEAQARKADVASNLKTGMTVPRKCNSSVWGKFVLKVPETSTRTYAVLTGPESLAGTAWLDVVRMTH